MLCVRLLGGFHVSYDETPLATLNSRQVQVLLAYLILHADAPQSRQQLAFLLWPDSSDAQAQSNLRTLLHRLRAALPQPDMYLSVDKRAVQWLPQGAFTLDVREFEAALARARAGEERRELDRAIDLYSGDLFPDCYDDWIQADRERLRQLRLGAVERSVELHVAQREYGAALVRAQQLVQLDPLQEIGYQVLMRLHTARGDRASLLRTFRICEDILRRELAVEPSSETRSLFRQLQDSSLQPADRPAPLAPGHLAHPALPAPLTSFIGRAPEMADVEGLLRRSRLVTLTGAGGSGKSRLALQVAHNLAPIYPNGAWWIDLAPLGDADLVLQAVASALKVREQPGRPLAESLAEALHSRTLLLILDNCEHLVQACANLAGCLLRAVPGLRILGTSREALGITGESQYPVPPLGVPEHVTDAGWREVAEAEAPHLFIERAQAVLPTFMLTQQNARLVADICERLDGIPLAIELAASRVRALSVEEIAARLDDRFNLLSSGDRTALPRHRTLRALVDWSYELLDQTEATLLRRLAVFAGGFTLEAAQAVCSDTGAGQSLPQAAVLETLGCLVNKSLVELDAAFGGAEARYRLLDTIRRYSADKLRESGEEPAFHDRHLAYFVNFAERAGTQLRSPRPGPWLTRLDSDYDNLRAAFAWSAEGDQADLGLRLASSLVVFWEARGNRADGRQWLQRAAERSWGASPMLRARALGDASALAFLQEDYTASRLLLMQSLAVYEERGDQPGIAEFFYRLGVLVVAIGYQEDLAAAHQLLDQSLAMNRASGNRTAVAYALQTKGAIAHAQADLATAQGYLEESLGLLQALDDRQGIGWALQDLGMVLCRQGAHEAGLRLLDESLASLRSAGGSHLLARTKLFLGHAARLRGDYPSARLHYGDALVRVRELGHMYIMLNVLDAIGCLAAAEGQYEKAAQILAAAEKHYEESRAFMVPVQRLEHERSFAAVRAAAAPATFDAAQARGRALTLEAAVALAHS